MKLRHWIAIAMLLIAPLQFSWAAVSAYCTHESGRAVHHLGHHEHQHQSDSADGTLPDPAKTGGIDPDCSGCHGHFVHLPSTRSADAVAYLQASDASLEAARYDSPFPVRPERPKWSALA